MKKINAFLLFALPLILSSCVTPVVSGTNPSISTGNNSETPTTSNPTTPEEKYIEMPEAPEYKKLTEEDYSFYKTFYIDSMFGNDSYSGLSETTPKKSLDSISNIISTYQELSPLRILLKRGSEFYGNLILTGYSATEEYPFILDAYGTGDMPVIHGSGSDADVTTNAILWIQEENTRVSNIEITGPECTRGIYVLPRKKGIYKNIVISNCYLHDINWNWDYPNSPDETHPADINPELVTPAKSINRYRRLYGGIEFFNGTIDAKASVNTGPITYDTIFVENNRIENVSHMGINVYNYWVNRGGIGYGYNKYVPSNPDYRNYETGVGYFSHKNLVFRNNFTNCTGGDGIVVDGTDNVWMTGNTSYKSSYLGRAGFFNAGIWVHNVRNGYLLYNEAAYTYLQHSAGDGQGMDIDIACENVHINYNYIHDNEGGGLLLCNNDSELFTYNLDGTLANTNKVRLDGIWNNNYARNNVFYKNGLETNNHRSAFITLARRCDDFVAENNTVIIDEDISKQHIINCEDSVVSYNHAYRNNIFMSAGQNSPIFANGTIDKPLFEGNLYFNVVSGNPLLNQLVLEDDPRAVINVNPKIKIPTTIDGFEQIYVFEPEGSLLSYATALKRQLKYDLKGKDTTNISYLGAIAK